MGLSSLGSAIGSASGAIYAMRAPTLQLRAFVPIIMSGVLAIYGLCIGVIIQGRNNPELSLTDGANNLSSGAAVGLSCLASGIGMALFMGRINDGSATASPKTESVVNSFDDEPLLSVTNNTEEAGAYSNESCRKIFFTSCFLVAIGWYGLIVAVLLVN